MKLPEAAVLMGIKESTARQYLHLPNARSYHNRLCALLREGEGPSNIKRAIQIRDNDEMLKSAAGSKAIVEANRYIESGGDKPAGVTVNVGFGVHITPGYQVVIPADYAVGARERLRAAGSTRHVVPSGGDVEDPPATAATPDSAPALTPPSTGGIRNREPAFAGAIHLAPGRKVSFVRSPPAMKA